MVHWSVNKAKVEILRCRMIYNLFKIGSIQLLLFINLCYIEDVIR